MNVVLISTYELGRQPFGLASPAAWLRGAGANVHCLDLSREDFPEDVIRAANLIAFYVPMHTATRLAVMLLEPVRKLNPAAHICFYGLYAPMNETYLRSLGVNTILGGEFEAPLLQLFRDLLAGSASVINDPERPVISLARQDFLLPDRSSLPVLNNYARLHMPDGSERVVGSTEATRGCKHLCRHCPIVPVYQGAFRVVARDVVLADVRQQVAAGAQHITFGDPDFFNGPRHATEIVQALHREFPALSYDVTIKIEHLLRRADLLPMLRDTGCAFVVTAAESVDDVILERLAKGHTRADFLAVVRYCREIGLPLQPTFVPFTPWTTLEGYCDLLRVLVEENLAAGVPPIQLAIRLLLPEGSLLLEL
ncbi:MAG TPA: CUAEP/CCAEP-tail radical SAM protein, partial [Candidatus Acidoferrales bacterium]|nr:CUAEP/CCAEP-tail radical SAM protein [Candidatus Acidoferrales bacterium]